MNTLSHKIFGQDLNQIMEQKKYTAKYGKQYMNSYKADQPIFFYNKWMNMEIQPLLIIIFYYGSGFVSSFSSEVVLHVVINE